MYEIALAEWHVTLAHINEHWTEEFFQLMFDKRDDRIRFSVPSDDAPKVPAPENGLSNNPFGGLDVQRHDD